MTTPPPTLLASLVERLRSDKHLTQFDGLAALLDTGAEAATALEALAAENETMLAALQVIANPDWSWATVEEMRAHAADAVATLERTPQP